MMNSPVSSKGSLLQRLDNLIVEAKKLSNRTRVTVTGELEDLKKRIRYCLADVEPVPREALQQVVGLRFEPPADPRQMSVSQRRFYDSLDKLIEVLEDVRNTIEVGQPPSLTSPAVVALSRSSEEQRVSPLPTPRGVTWRDVFIRFVSDFAVQITVLDATLTRNFVELGFEDQRGKKKPKPDSSWVLLRKLAEMGGAIANETEAGMPWPKVEKAVQTLRQRLRHLFRIPDDPFESYRKAKCYRANFNVEFPNADVL